MTAIGVLLLSSPCRMLQAQTANQSQPDAMIGALKNVSAEKVLQAVDLVKKGKVYSLAIVVLPTEEGSKNWNKYKVHIAPIPSAGTNKTTGFVDDVAVSPGVGTSMDGLGHAGRDHVHYNGVSADRIFDPNGVKQYGIETVPPIVTRGLLLDVAGARRQRILPKGSVINRAEIESIAKAEGIRIQRGDFVLFNTGWLLDDAHGKDPENELVGEAGLNSDGAQYLASLGVAAVGSDTPGVEVYPSEVQGEMAPVHAILIADNGIFLFEKIRTEELAADRVYEFLFIAAPPRLSGTVQSALTPIAIR